MKIRTLFDGTTPVSETNIGQLIAGTNSVSLQYDYVGTSLTLKIFISVNGDVYQELTDVTVSITESTNSIINIHDLTRNTKLKITAAGDGTIKLDTLF